jgi:hypothetical protein
MSLGAVMIRPQPLTAPPAPIAASDVLVAFAESLLKDPTMTLPALKIMGEEATKFVIDTVARFEEPMRLGDGKVRAIFQPFVGPVNQFIDGLSGDAATAIPAVLQSSLALLEQLTTENIVSLVSKLLDFIQNDLGLSGAKLRGLLTQLTTRMIEALQQRVVNGDNSKEAVALYDFGVGLDDLQILLDQQDIPFPTLNTQQLLDEIRKVWASFGLDRVIALIRAIIERGEEVVAPLATIAQAIAEINISVQAARPVAAARSRKNGFMATNGTSDPPPINVDQTSIAWYASWVAGKTVRGPEQVTILKGFTFGQTLTQEKMEQIAFHTAWIFPLVEGVLFHATSAEEGDVGNNIMLLLENLIQMGVVAFDKEDVPLWVRWPVAGIMPWIGTLESGLRGCWWFHLGGDIFENLLYRMWSWEMRELLLSILTLLNDDRDQFQQKNLTDDGTLDRNPYFFQGVCHAAVELGNLLFFGFYRDRSRYFLRSGNVGLGSTPMFQQAFWVPQALAFGSTLFGYLIAFLLDKAQSLPTQGAFRLLQVWFRDRMFGRYSFQDGKHIAGTVARMVLAYFSYSLQFLVYRYMFTEGDTDSGTFAMDNSSSSLPGNIQFMGYPDPQTSPYVLPWTGAERMCVQGNMGVITHNPQNGTGQVYAVDFEMASQQELLASRAGIIVNITDTNLPGTNNWNFVEIMHLIVALPGSTLPQGAKAAATVQMGAGGIPVPATFGDGTAIPGTFADGTTPIPPGTVFPLYPIAVPLHPSAVILPPGWAPPAAAPYYQGFSGFPVNTTFAFLLPGHDRGLGGDPGKVLSNGASGGALIPLQATFATYGHGFTNFMQQTAAGAPAIPGAPNQNAIYRSSNPAQVLGQFVQQGQVIMQAGTTGISSFNHVHMQVSGQISSGGGANWSIPFVFKDVKAEIAHGIFKAIALKDGVPKVFTTYSPTTTRIAPA